MKSTAKIKYGRKRLLSKDEFDPKNGKFRVTMFVDLDVLDALRDEAKECGLPYQTHINQVLRKHVEGDDEIEHRFKRIESKLGIKDHIMHMGKKR